MAVTVELDEELAGLLKREADAVQVSVGDFAVRILRDAVCRTAGPDDWSSLNSRRLDLIALEYSQGLSGEEARELEALQEVAVKGSEPEDKRLLNLLKDRERRANFTAEAAHE